MSKAPVAGRWTPAAVLWDLDGTLIESQVYWHAAEYELAARHGGAWNDEHSLALTGADLLDAGRYIQTHMGLQIDPEQIVEELVEIVAEQLQNAVLWRDGAVPLVTGLAAEGIPCGLVTMSYRSLVAPVLAALPGDPFSVVVAGDEVTHGKPHPEPYLVAAAALGLDPRDCIALEDSATGATSAAAAGCRVIVVPSHTEVPPDGRWTLLPSLADSTPASLAALVC